MPEDESVPSIPLTIFQVIAAPLGGLLFGLIGVELIDTLTGRPGHQVAGWLCCAALGFLQGYATQTIFPRADASGGRFVWVIRVCVLLSAVLLSSGRNELYDLTHLNPYSMDGLVAGFVTMPTFASGFYAIGIFRARPSGTQLK